MAGKPTSVEIRAYRVGFGDCLLVSFVYSASDRRHVLIDFGSTKLPPAAGNGSREKYFTRIAEDIRATCGGALTAVVVTHRHRDHVSGFATDGKKGGPGAIIAACKPRLVLQPWTEDPDAATDARGATRDSSRSRQRFVESLSRMHRIAEAACRVAQSPGAAAAPTAGQLGFLGEVNLTNPSAVRNLIAMGQAPGARSVWAHHGSDSGLEELLPGVKVHVLGPPDLRQSEKIRKMRTRDPDQFWQLAATPAALRAAMPRAGRAAAGAGQVPPEARWFCSRVAGLGGAQLLEIVRILDEQMNNTSLVLLFEVGRRKLLFPGDAQIENWSYALEDAPDRARTRELLADVDFYKVGHHGSRNATPKGLLWENFTRRGAGGTKRLTTVLSTIAGNGHGSEADRTEVPRETLVTALAGETDLFRTDEPSEGAPALCELVRLPVARG